MVRGSEVRKADHEIERLFLDRWSPRAMSGEAISDQELMQLFEAARWAPSSYNGQPWRMLYARRDTEHWQRFYNLMGEFNQSWTKNAAVLVVFISRTRFEHNEKPAVTHSFDTGAAWENLALQGSLLGLVVHGMEGFDFERARVDLQVPEVFRVEAMAAIGRPAPADTLPEEMRKREVPSDRRKVSESICEGPFRL